jgi:GTPase
MERAIICAVFDPTLADTEAQAILDEMCALAGTAGAEIIGVHSQKRSAPDRRTMMGSGKVEEIREKIEEQSIETVIFYNVLSQMQQRNLEEALEHKVIDRTRLILDIFAARARSLEGKLQVELAQLLYLLPRLTGRGVAMSRLGGGIGTRGPGETKLEVDRRTIKRHIAQIRDRLEEVTRNREVQRRHRHASPAPLVSLVGYTSAGKSTLFQALSKETVLVSSKLFSTLDPLLRRVPLDDIEPGYHFLLSDTVGFIRRMPEELFTSFRATLEEVVQADIVLHIVDLSASDWEMRRHEVESVLTKLDVPGERVITVFNKIDCLEGAELWREKNGGRDLYVSARQGWGLAELKRAIFSAHFSDYGRHELDLPPGMTPETVSRWAIVTKRFRTGAGWRVEILCSRENMVQFVKSHGGYVS